MSIQVFTARVQGGAIVLEEGVELAEGCRVTVVAGEADVPFMLSEAEVAELAEAIGGADRGEVVSAAELLSRPSR